MSASLIIAPQWIGDAVMTEPLLRRLHARGERLSVAALPWVAPVYRAMPQVTEIIEVPFAHGGLQWRARRQIARQLQGRFETAYVLPNSLKSALVPLWAGIPQRVGYLGEARVGLLTHRLKNPPKAKRPPMVALYSALSGEPDGAQDRPQLRWPVAEQERILAQQGLSAGDYLVFAPGAEYGPAKRWPSRHFAALAALVDAPVLVLGSAKERALCEEIVAAAPRVRNLAGQTSLHEAIGLIASARAVVSNDSGLMHVAAGLGVAQVAVFGSSSPEHTPPLSDRAQVIWLKRDASYQPPLDCAPCFERECPLGHTRCLVDVSAQRVRASLALLSAP
ncbi:MAG: lipopolysaccharide heptosyltransferase II [Betaproteobacteria bacterium]|nr:lipopolysaccharide heptosyltransferase II [Betaproteobacteria bacterium]